jgi:hypothetical protein
VTVNPQPTVTITANPALIALGSSSTLSINATDATQVTVAGTDESSYSLGASGGTETVSPTATTTYTATATGAGGTTTATATVTVTTATTVSISANPTSIAGGSNSNLTVTAANASQVTVTGSDGSSYSLTATGGSRVVSPASTTTYTATATGAATNATASLNVTVETSPNVFTNLQTTSGWESWGQIPPTYTDCTNCNGLTWSMTQGITSPSESGDATEFTTTATTPYADVLWVNPVIGQFSTEGLPDKNQTIIPNLYNFTYDSDFYVTNAAATQALEFDVADYIDGLAMFWGTQCANLGDGTWVYLNDVTKQWISTGFPCNFVDGWNHVTLQFRRLAGNELQFSSITLNGVTAYVNETSAPYTVPSSWYGITVNYQMDGFFKHTSTNTTYVDNLTFTYW